MICPCGSEACDVISLAPNYHLRACPTCATQWPLVRSAIQATEGREWTMGDFKAWYNGKRAA